MRWRWSLLFALVAVPVLAQPGRISDVLSPSHTFAPGNPGPITSSDTRPCIFCHISHSGLTVDGYLWNHRPSQAGYTPYQSPSMNAPAANPSAGTAKLCLRVDFMLIDLIQLVRDRLDLVGLGVEITHAQNF